MGDLEAREAIPRLLPLLNHPDSQVRSASIHALERMDAHEAIPILAGLLNDPDPWVRKEAEQAIADLSSIKFQAESIKTLDVSNYIEKAKADPDAVAVLVAMAILGNEMAFQALKSQDIDVRGVIEKSRVDPNFRPVVVGLAERGHIEAQAEVNRWNKADKHSLN